MRKVIIVMTTLFSVGMVQGHENKKTVSEGLTKNLRVTHCLYG